MKGIYKILIIFISYITLASNACDYSKNIYLIIENESDEDIRVFIFLYPENNNGSDDEDLFINMVYKVSKNNFIESPMTRDTDVDDYIFERQVFIVKESNFRKHYIDKQYDKIVFDKHYVIRNTDFRDGNLTIKYEG